MSYMIGYKAPIFVAVEGIIGVGKTTFAKALGEEMRCKVHFEPVDENPYLARYYADPQAWALPTQFHFMALRAAQADAIRASEMNAICDRSLNGDMAFALVQAADGFLTDETFDTYCKVFRAIANRNRLPNKTIYLKCDVSTAQSRIAKRGRAFERGIPDSYLESLKDAIELGLLPSSSIVVDWNADRAKSEIKAEAKRIAKELLK